MKVVKKHPILGDVTYEENDWTGKKILMINGQELEKINQTTFAYQSGENKREIKVEGGLFKGAKLNIAGEKFEMIPAVRWYEILCSVLIAAIVYIWSHVPSLMQIFPIIGGAVGGFISGLFAMFNLIAMRYVSNVWPKLLIWFGFLCVTILVCFLGGMIF